MGPAKSAFAKELYHEIETTPEEYLPALLEIVRGFRHGVLLKPADDSFRQGMKEAGRQYSASFGTVEGN